MRDWTPTAGRGQVRDTEREAQMAKGRRFDFEINDETVGLLDELKRAFGVFTNVAVLRKSLALAKLCVDMKRDDNTVSFVGADGVEKVILLDR